MTTDVTVNGHSRSLASGTSLGLVVDEQGRGRRGVAAAVNEQLVPRREWDGTELRPGDRVEIVTATQGG